MGLQVSQVSLQAADDVVDEGLSVPVINSHEHLLCQLRDLEVGLTGHVLHTWVRLVHKLVELVHHCLQEGPVIDEEVGELADNVHDVRSDEGFRVLRRALLTKIQQLFDHGAQELVLTLHIHAARDGPQSPAKLVQRVKVDLVDSTSSLHLLETDVHDLNHLLCIRVCQEDKRLAHPLVESDVL